MGCYARRNIFSLWDSNILIQGQNKISERKQMTYMFCSQRDFYIAKSYTKLYTNINTCPTQRNYNTCMWKWGGDIESYCNNSQWEFKLPEDSSMFLKKPYFSQENSEATWYSHIHIFQWKFEQARFIFYASDEDIFLNKKLALWACVLPSWQLSQIGVLLCLC